MAEGITRVGVREFREDLASYIDSPTPIAITRHGATVGFFFPVRKRASADDLLALRKAVERTEEILRKHGITEDEIVDDFRKVRTQI